MYDNCDFQPPKIIEFVVFHNMSLHESTTTVQDVAYFTPTKDNPSTMSNDIDATKSPIDTSEIANDTAVETDIASDVPIEIAAATAIVAITLKPPPSSAISVLSPASSTRSKATTRKRSTPEKYIPEMGTTTKRRADIFNTKNKPTSSNKKNKKPNDKEIVDVDSILPLPTPTRFNKVKQVPIVEDSEVEKYQRDAIAKKNIRDKDPDNTAKVDAYNASQRRFLQSLFEIKLRNYAKISWAGWLMGYCREIKVTACGLRYMKTSK